MYSNLNEALEFMKKQISIHKDNFPYQKFVNYLVTRWYYNHEKVMEVVGHNISKIKVRRILSYILYRCLTINIHWSIDICKKHYGATDEIIKQILEYRIKNKRTPQVDFFFLDISKTPKEWLSWFLNNVQKPKQIIDKFDRYMPMICSSGVEFRVTDEILKLWISYYCYTRYEVDFEVCKAIIIERDIRLFSMLRLVATNFDELLQKTLIYFFLTAMSVEYETLVFIVRNKLIPSNERFLLILAVCRIYEKDKGSTFPRCNEDYMNYYLIRLECENHQYNKDYVEDVQTLVIWRKYFVFIKHSLDFTIDDVLEEIYRVSEAKGASEEVKMLKHETIYKNKRLLDKFTEISKGYHECIIC